MVKKWHPEPAKKLIYNSETGQYLTAHGDWTGDEKAAKDFPSVFQALEFCCQWQVSNAELIFKFEDGRYEASIPLADCIPQQDLLAK